MLDGSSYLLEDETIRSKLEEINWIEFSFKHAVRANDIYKEIDRDNVKSVISTGRRLIFLKIELSHSVLGSSITLSY